MPSQLQFVRQQGFPDRMSTTEFYQTLMFQPRVVGCLLVFGVLMQSPWYFLGLSALLAWNAFVPVRNVFDAFYNRTIADRRGRVRLTAAPAPRRFAQELASTLALGISIALFSHAMLTAWIVEALFAAAVIALVFGRFCVGAFLYHALHRAKTPVVHVLVAPRVAGHPRTSIE